MSYKALRFLSACTFALVSLPAPSHAGPGGAFSPDGEWIAFWTDWDGNYDFLLELETGVQRLLAAPSP